MPLTAGARQSSIPPFSMHSRHMHPGPSGTRRTITDVASPFLIGFVGREVPVQKIGRDIEAVIAIGRGLIFAGSLHTNAILPHQTTNSPMANTQTQLLQFFCHARSAIATQAEARLLLYMGQNNHISPLSLTGGALAKGTKAPSADFHDLTETCDGKRLSVFLDKSEPHDFWLAKIPLSDARIACRSVHRGFF